MVMPAWIVLVCSNCSPHTPNEKVEGSAWCLFSLKIDSHKNMPLPTVKPFFSHDLEVKSRELVPITQSLPFTHVQHVIFLTHQHRCRLPISVDFFVGIFYMYDTTFSVGSVSVGGVINRPHPPPAQAKSRIPPLCSHIPFSWIIYGYYTWRPGRESTETAEHLTRSFAFTRLSSGRTYGGSSSWLHRRISANAKTYSWTTISTLQAHGTVSTNRKAKLSSISDLCTTGVPWAQSWAELDSGSLIKLNFLRLWSRGTVVDAPIVQLVTLNSPVPSLSLKC